MQGNPRFFKGINGYHPVFSTFIFWFGWNSVYVVQTWYYWESVGFIDIGRRKSNTIIGGHKWNYFSTCTVNMYDILKAKKAFSMSMYYVMEYTICSFLFLQCQSYICFYFLNISVCMKNEKSILFFIYIGSVIQKSQDKDHFCEIMFLEQYKHRENIKRQTIFFASSYLPTSFSSIYLPLLCLLIFLPRSHSSLTHFTASFFFHFHYPCLSSSSAILKSCYCD